jgi:hypothetical protein
VILHTALDLWLTPRDTERHGHRHRLQVLWKEPEDDHAVAAWHHGDTPHNATDPHQAKQPRLNDKLRVPGN